MRNVYRREQRRGVAVVRRRRKVPRYVWFVLGAVLLVQFFYPKSWMTPFTRLDGRTVNGLSEKELDDVIRRYADATLFIEMKGDSKTVRSDANAAVAGLIPDVDSTKQALQNYPWWQRVMPFSLFLRGFLVDHHPTLKVNRAVHTAFIDNLLPKCAVAAKNAGLKIVDNEAVIDPSKNGQACEARSLEEAISGVKLEMSGTKIAVTAKTVAPARKDKDVKKLVGDANKMINRSMTLVVADESFPLEKATLARFVAVAESTEQKTKLTLSTDETAVRDYLEGVEKSIYQEPNAGAAGLALDYGVTSKRLREQAIKDGGKVMGATVKLPAGMVGKKLYAPTREGLQDLLDAIVDARGSYGISVRYLDGTAVSSRGDVSYHPASTYKMYVAYVLLKRIERGEMNWSQASANGTVERCFELMIVQSDNTCAEWFGSKIGWSTISSEIRALGLTNTSTAYGGQRSTANDETLFLVKLQNGELLRDAEQQKLLAVMKRQVFRKGIPAGVGVPVADKVGFLDGDLHDAAIVYAPGQTYAMTILTTGSSWASIADAAMQIQVQLNRM